MKKCPYFFGDEPCSRPVERGSGECNTHYERKIRKYDLNGPLKNNYHKSQSDQKKRARRRKLAKAKYG